ncbi:hypothetical protein [Mesorhizobium sp. M0207]|uniref:hypothetical protein n=1 Tax=Mesorhizobium sp. M0207 TaxID=2956915 RepID=UPI00333A278A
MIPIRLNWQKPRDGVEIILDESGEAMATEHPNLDYRDVRARSERMDPVNYHVPDLENPVALHFINCRGDDDLVAFLNRFGLPERLTPTANLDRVFMSVLVELKEDLEEVFRLNSHSKTVSRTQRANELLSRVSLRPTFDFSESGGGDRLVLEPSSLGNLMAMEAAFAFQMGAILSHCARCSKAYLTGPLTGRRSHSVYCSDRCRVAAMRARNVKKVPDQETN